MVSSYRPISLTSVLSKVMERLVTDRLSYVMESEKIFTNIQSGFRKHRCTTDHILKLQDEINKNIHFKKHTLAVFIDFKSAFDMLWCKGLLVKLNSYGIVGNIYNYIENFLSDRTMQVRIDQAYSSVHHLENGTAQGSIISPLLFLIMINDLPNSLFNVEASLFADDSCIYKSGKNLPALVECIQQNLINLQTWCDRWGFNISLEKTTAVLFTYRHENIPCNLRLKEGSIKFEKTAKFLGVIFDRKLTWKAHISYIIEKCKKRLNLMRMVSGQFWGATKTLLLIYKSLIRSVLDYGSVAYDSACSSLKNKLDSIQYQALRIATGAIHATAASALQVDTGEIPLYLRRYELQLKYCSKVKAINDHPDATVFKHWRYEDSNKFNRNTRPIFSKVKDFFNQFENDVIEPVTHSKIVPWKINYPSVDLDLTNEFKKNESPVILKCAALAKIDSFNDCLKIYTDASKNNCGAAAAFYIPEFRLEGFAKLPELVSIYAAELIAIKLALVWLNSVSFNIPNKILILSDSLSGLQSISSGMSDSRPNLLHNIF